MSATPGNIAPTRTDRPPLRDERAAETSFTAVAGIDSLAAHAPVVEITADRDNARYLSEITHFVAESNRRSGRRRAALVPAVLSGPKLGAMLDEPQQRRCADILALVDELRARGLASSIVPRQTHADALSFILYPEGNEQLAHDTQWRQDAYESWLVRAARAPPAPPLL
ncbi:hypothetical protein [Leucobacter komagatae]|uniref:hypothetical protein n=1 Tax=Leucobacter komagatae TaxID=55969 RepID=UPI0012ECEA09|nr:hypothetical protein [Leucobacter komagatae]